jgi:hypothetical protein
MLHIVGLVSFKIDVIFKRVKYLIHSRNLPSLFFDL